MPSVLSMSSHGTGIIVSYRVQNISQEVTIPLLFGSFGINANEPR